MKYEDFISRFPKSKPNQRGVMVACPSHDDNPKTPSLSIGRSNDGGVLLKCFAGCTTEQVVGSLNLTMRDLFAGEQPIRFNPPMRQALEKPENADEKPSIDKIYSYEDSTGKEVYQALRLKPKSFRQRHKANDGKWNWTMDGVLRVLYKLPQVLKSRTIFIVEGEKDAENLFEIGFVATCNVGGAGKWLDGYTESVLGKDVILCGDNDEPGKKHMELVFNSIAGSASTVKILKIPEPHKDASDYIASFKTKVEAKAAFDSLISSAYPHIKGTLLPIYSISEIEDDYRTFARQLDRNSFPLGRWLPSFNSLRPLVIGELVFIIGDTGTGKTGLLQSISKAALPLPTLFFEMELPKELMFERYVASMSPNMTCSDVERAYANTTDDSMREPIDKKLGNLFICPEPKLTVAKIENYIMRAELKIGERPKVVLIDYIQLIAGAGESRRERISDIAEGLKIMAKATQTIVIVSSQVSRPPKQDAKDKSEWRPSLHSAKESGSIEASCGLLLSAWRDANDGRLLNLQVLKSTKGGAGLHVKCNFNGAKMEITERTEEQ